MARRAEWTDEACPTQSYLTTVVQLNVPFDERSNGTYFRNAVPS